MNKVYKVVWNRTKHCYVVVSELAKRAGKNKSTCLTVVGKAAAALGLGAVLLMGSAGSEVYAATGNKVIGGSQTAVTDAKGKTDQAAATGDYSTVSGGYLNHADGKYSSVSGGSKNHAKGENASISGGEDNEAWGDASSVSGGGQNKATGKDSSVTGGGQNQAGGEFATVSGGTGNKAFGYGSIVIGGTGNVTGKVAVDDNNGNPLTDTNGNQYSADRDSDPFSRIGQDSVAIGGVSSSVQGNYSVGIAGGSTSAKAASGLAAGKQATVTVANGVAIGYQATASVIDSTRTADKEGRIVSFGHQKGDVYYDVDYQNHTVTEKKYTSDAYNRLVNVADGIDDHDVVVMEQLKNAKAEAVAEAKTNIKVKGDEYNVHADESTDAKGVQTTTISLLPKVTLQDTAKDPTGAKQVVLDGTAGTISAGLSTDQQNYISLNGTTGVAKVGAVEIGNQNFTYTYDKPDGMNDNGTVKLTSTRANANGTFVTGLSNRTWTPGNYVTGRAATEDQLEQAGRHFLSIKTAYVDENGNKITPVAENTLANYYNDGATGSASMAFGVGTTAKGNLSLAMGVNSSASGLNSLAIGYANTASGTQSVAVGNGTHASGNYSVAMGLGSQAGTQNKNPESTDNGAAVAVGFEASAEQTGSAAYGYMASANNFESSAFGTSAQANKDGSVALGAHSVANREKGVKGYLIPDEVNDIVIKEEGDKGNTSADTKIDTAIWMSTDGAVSLGGKTKNAAGQDVTISRQITNLAAGSEDSDAVNVAQLKALASQGLNFQGNDTTTSVHLNQGGTLQIQGSGTKANEEYSTQNVKVLTDADHQRLSIALDKNPDFDSVTAGTALTDADGGKTGSIKIVGADSKNANKATTITAGYAASPELAGANGTGRISYTDGDGTAHTVATLGDGLKLAGDTGTGSVALDNTLTVSGGATNLANGDNIGVTANGSTLSLKLAKNITGLDTVMAGGVKMGTQTDGNDTTKSGNYVTGLDNKTWTVGQTNPVSGRAATEDQLQQVANAIVNGKETGGGFGLSDNAGTVVKQDLGGAIQLKAADSNLSTQADSANKAIVVSLNKELNLTKTTLTDGTGATTVVDGNGVVITPKQGTDADKVKLTNDGLSNGGKQITNVQSGLTGTTIKDAAGDVLNHGATIGDLQTVSNGVKTDLTATGLNFKGNNEDTTVHRNLGDTLIIQGTGADGRAYDGGANVQVLANKDTGTLTVQLDRDLNAHTLTLGKASTGTDKTGEAGTLIINGKSNDNSTQPVSISTGYQNTTDDTKTALKTNMSRITYSDDTQHTHTVATLEDGLQFSGDNGNAIDTKLNKKVTIKGGTKTADLVDSSDTTKNNNIGVTTSTDDNGNTTLSLQLAKNITGLNTVTAGTVVMGYQTVTSKGNVSSTGNYVTGLDNKAWDGTDYVSGRAATEDQLKKVSDSIQTSVNSAQFGITAGGLADGGDVTVKKNLGESIRIYGDAPLTNEKNDGSGDFWDRSKANILTKVKKDHDGNDYVSVELQDHLEVGTHAGKDTDGKAVAGVDGSMQFKGASAKEVNITGDTGIALSDNGNQTAALRQDNGAGYLDLTGTTAGTKAAVSVHTGAKNLAKQDQTRLTYTDQDSKAHDVATLDDGLIFVGDTGTVSQALNSTLKISGGVSNASDLSDGKNVGVVASSDGLAIKLAKNLTGIDSITGLKNTTIGPDFATQGRAATEEQLKLMQSSITSSITQSAQGGGFALTSDEKGDDKIVKQDLGKAIQIKGDTTYKADGSVEKEGNIKTSIDNGAIKVGLNKDVDLGNDGSIKAGGVTISNKGIDAGSQQITNVASGATGKDDKGNAVYGNDSNAANIGDVKTLAGEAAKTEIGKLGSRDFAGDDGETVSRGLGESMKLSGGADASKLTNGNIGVVKNAAGDGLDIKLSSELTGLTSVTTGNTTMSSDGIKIAANGDNTHAVEITNSNVSMGGQQIHDVAPGTSDTDAVNVSQLKGLVSGVDGAVNRLNNRLNRVGAGAAALAALHPLDFNPEDKWNFAAGFGHYVNANAGAIGAFYQPNEDTLFSLAGSWGGGENMVNAGVSIRLGHGNSIMGSRTVMAREIMALKQQVEAQNLKLKENEDLKARLAKQDQEIAELKAMVLKLAAKG